MEDDLNMLRNGRQPQSFVKLKIIPIQQTKQVKPITKQPISAIIGCDVIVNKPNFIFNKTHSFWIVNMLIVWLKNVSDLLIINQYLIC